MSIIILSTTVQIFNVYKVFQKNKQERLDTYLKSIREWINTDFKILVVDNSGYTFPELEKKNNLHILSFTYDDVKPSDYILKSVNKGHHELFSLHYALQHIPKEWDYTKVFKLTGRYFIPNFKEHVDMIPEKSLYYIQNKETRCELFGCNKKYIDNLFVYPEKSKHRNKNLETIKKNIIDDLVEEHGSKDIIHKFDELVVVPVIKGSRNTIMTKI